MNMMLGFIIAIFLMVLSLGAVTLLKAYFYVPAKELKHRAERGDHVSAALHTVAVYGGETQLLLAAMLVLTAAAGIVLFAQVAPSILGIAAVTLILVLGFFWQPRTKLTKTEAELAVWCAPTVVWLLVRLQTVLRPVVSWAEGKRLYQRHTRLFDAADFEALLERQRQQRDNRIGEDEMERMRRALKFGHLRVGDAMTPRAKVKAVPATDPLSPVLVDELHRSGHARFPVYDDEPSKIVGTLAMEQIADVKLHGTVDASTDHHLAYLHQDDTLVQALRAFYETRQHLFVVLNARGTYAGILTLTDILQELAGRSEGQAFGRYDDHDAVMARHQPKKTVAENETEVVE